MAKTRDIFERLYAVRLDRLRESEECRELLQPLDTQGLLGCRSLRLSPPTDEPDTELDDEALLASLGIRS
jgi:hypothetical protein